MPVTTIDFRPGINRESTDYGNEGGWYDCNLVRFRNGYPEKFGGWEAVSTDTYVGVARSLQTFTSLIGQIYTGVGTNSKLYVERGGTYNDITPLRRTSSLGSNPITTGAAASGEITITDNGHGALVGDYLTLSGATAVDDITADELNAEHIVTEVVDINTFKVVTAGSATAGATAGGGSSITAEYQISVGYSDVTFGTGYGTGTYSRGTWNSGSTPITLGEGLRTWSMSPYGEDLLACIRNAGVYYWDTSIGTGARAQSLADFTGSAYAPTIAHSVLALTESRIVVAFGANPLTDTTTQDPLLIRWSDSEDLTTWLPDTDNLAGSLRVTAGSYIQAARRTRGETLIWTDSSLHSLQFVGGQLVFGLTDVSLNVSLAGPNAVAVVEDTAYWMGARGFFSYNGRVNNLPCTVEDYVFSDINTDQLSKVFCGVNSKYQEIFWFYPSSGSTEIDRYVTYHHRDGLWYYGSMARTAWENAGLRNYAIGADEDTSKLYFHDLTHDDGSTTPASAMNAYITSSHFDIGDGDRFMFVSEFIPDITFRNSDAASPQATYTFTVNTEPGSGALETETSDTVRSTTTPVEAYTKKGYIRKRGRSMSVKISSSDTGVAWRTGKLRINMRPDGRR